ncbi:nose resistant to fluoxetine protein 6 [Trichonephila inaurata madagascariensis]|uniref:Nose resistant to fluoxetine protein 6 n=1 Tax=Trichonephila inaurata madagascariensis TaxID=2747483 RepID=A0A8X6XR76_9ARAC|nr:nose resistant to fluoxetine protein 6 [Trichonephila inaurata madagascariensis]
MFTRFRKNYQKLFRAIKLKNSVAFKNKRSKVCNIPMVQVKNSSENSLTEEFLVIFKLFQLIGIDVINAEKVNEESERKYGLLHRISRYSKIIVFTLQSIEIFITISWLLFSIDKLTHLIHIFLGISMTTFYVSLCKRRRAVLHVTERINHIYEMVPQCSFRGKKYPFIAIFVIMQILAVAWIILRWCMITTSTSQMNKSISAKLWKWILPQIVPNDHHWQATFVGISIHLKHELQAHTNVSVTYQEHAPKKLTTEAKFMIFIISIFLILAAIGTTITAYDNYYRPKKKRRSSDGEINVKKNIHSHTGKTSNEASFKNFRSFFNCFCIYTNGRRIFRSDCNEEDFSWLHGLKFLGTILTIVIHVNMAYFVSLSDFSGLKPWFDYRFMPFILNGSHMISYFFVLSGFLNGYFISRYYFQNGAIPWFYYYWKKFERTAPLYAMILGFYAILFSYTGSGPVWPTYGTNPVCKESWWWNLFFINNFQSSWKQVTILQNYFKILNYNIKTKEA